MTRFERIGVSFRFAPSEADLVLEFSRPDQKGTSWEVAVRRHLGHLFTRRIQLLTDPARGNTKALIDEVLRLGIGDEKLLQKLLLEVTESVLASHRTGHPSQELNGPMRRPPPPAWLSWGLLLKNKPNCWLGAASTGKSTLAKAICTYYSTGFRFCDRDMEQGVAMYLDWEDDYESFARTVFDICANLGVRDDWPPLIYVDMHGSRLRDRVESLAREIHQRQVGLLVLDAVAAMGAVPDEHVTYETIALEMADCLDSLPPVTVLALDHVTGEEHKAIRNGGLKGRNVPSKGRGSVRKLEYFRNQWTLTTDAAAEEVGRHVVNWDHTKLNLGKLERPGFATEILHYPEEISIMVRAQEVDMQPSETDQTGKLLLALGDHWRSPRELALEVDGHEPPDSRVESVRTLLNRAVEKGRAVRDQGRPVRYSARQDADQGTLIPFPGSA